MTRGRVGLARSASRIGTFIVKYTSTIMYILSTTEHSITLIKYIYILSTVYFVYLDTLIGYIWL